MQLVAEMLRLPYSRLLFALVAVYCVLATVAHAQPHKRSTPGPGASADATANTVSGAKTYAFYMNQISTKRGYATYCPELLAGDSQSLKLKEKDLHFLKLFCNFEADDLDDDDDV